uniref:Uncharacterized protein n=1 Tax=uncultured Thiotrichaceae bacterium TaxID=298394 RepID=A0A6S6U6M1_9GAMM|nr:MAG: Unknown protein [uncultured Thiotrichaceae bacterium]
MTSSGFLKQSNQDMLLVANTVDEALEQMQQYGVPIEGKWIGRD